MDRRRSAGIALLCVLLACESAPPPPPPPAGAGTERVVLVTIDTLRADYVGAYGASRARTPTLDRIASEGVRFETAIAPTPLTLPSHATIHTGLDPTLHGVHHNAVFKLERVPTLAQHFHEAGFATAAFVAAVVLDRSYGLDVGFDSYDDQMDYRRTTPEAGGHGERTADHVIDSALRWLEAAPERFFVWIHLYDPHANYRPPEEFRPQIRRPPPSPDEVGFVKAVAAAVPPYYAGEIAFADAQLGRFLEAVDRRFGRGGTLVVATSDHGESLGEHGELTHTLTVYDATQRVPLLMSGPGLPRGSVVSTPVRLVDIAPTVIAQAGLRPLPRTTGVDLGPWIRGERDDPLEAYVETVATHLDYGWSPVYGMRSHQWKYLRKPVAELYDVEADPEETSNLAAARPEVVAELEAMLAARLESARPLETNQSPAADERSLLQSLGYVVGAPSEELPELGWVGGPDPSDHLHVVASLIEARSALGEGRPDEALAVLAGVPEAQGWVAEARADAALAAGDAAEAERHARKAVEAQPRATAYISLGRALLALERADDARAAFERAAELDPTDPDATAELGRMAEERGDVARAVELYEKAAGGRAPNADAALHLAALNFEQGRPGRARQLLRDAWLADDASAEARIRAARAEARAGYPDLALERLREAAGRSADSDQLATAFNEIAETHGVPHFPDPSSIEGTP